MPRHYPPRFLILRKQSLAQIWRGFFFIHRTCSRKNRLSTNPRSLLKNWLHPPTWRNLSFWKNARDTFGGSARRAFVGRVPAAWSRKVIQKSAGIRGAPPAVLATCSPIKIRRADKCASYFLPDGRRLSRKNRALSPNERRSK